MYILCFSNSHLLSYCNIHRYYLCIYGSPGLEPDAFETKTAPKRPLACKTLQINNMMNSMNMKSYIYMYMHELCLDDDMSNDQIIEIKLGM